MVRAMTWLIHLQVVLLVDLVDSRFVMGNPEFCIPPLAEGGNRPSTSEVRWDRCSSAERHSFGRCQSSIQEMKQ